MRNAISRNGRSAALHPSLFTTPILLASSMHGEPQMEINGIAHIQITVNDLALAMPFYERVLGYMGMRPVVKAPNFLYMIGGRSAVAITRSSEDNRHYRFDQRRIGLHHVCFRARSSEDIDTLYQFLVDNDVRIVHPPEPGDFAPGYY